MTLAHILVFSAGGVLYSLLVPPRLRAWALLIISIIAVYALQSALPIRYADFMLPTATLLLSAAAWWATRPPDYIVARGDRITLAVLVALVLGMSSMRYLRADLQLTPSRPPDLLLVVLVLVVIVGIGAVVWRVAGAAHRGGVLTGMIVLIVALFAVLKAEPLAVASSAWLRGQAGQETELAAMMDLQWLGFSYVAFRLIHTLRDRQTGKLPTLALREFVTYIIFFPALTAGPIDRAERFVQDVRAIPHMVGRAAPRLWYGAGRITIGLFKKFVVADSLALLALNGFSADNAASTAGLWVLMYAYAFRLYFDFSGYTDIAIGIGVLFGVMLPENFDRPYLRQNISAFWQSWHMTLSNWVRFYVFSPLSRRLLKRKPRPSPLMVVLIAQLATMLVIGVWHGVTLNFVLWGVWHAVGLFVHKVWSDRTRMWFIGLKDKPRLAHVWSVAGVVLTFHFVVLSWVWFAIPDSDTAARVFLKLFGVGA